MSSSSGRKRDKHHKSKALDTSTGEDAALDSIARRVSHQIDNTSVEEILEPVKPECTCNMNLLF